MSVLDFYRTTRLLNSNFETILYFLGNFKRVKLRHGSKIVMVEVGILIFYSFLETLKKIL